MRGTFTCRLCWLGGVLLALMLMTWAATRTRPPPLPQDVVKETRILDCNGTPVRVDFYFHNTREPRPGVVVAHGFTRSKRYMAGWGAALAERGMVAAVLTQPFLADHPRNAEAILGVLEAGRRQEWPAPVTDQTGLVGFSMGGLTTLLAAAKAVPPVNAWVGLDPVDFDGLGAAVADKVNAPGLVLFAEPAPFNLRGNGRRMAVRFGGPLRVWKVNGANHCDAEWPTDLLGQLACGWVDPERHVLFRQAVLSFLEETLLARQSMHATPQAGLEAVSLERWRADSDKSQPLATGARAQDLPSCEP